MLGPLPTTGEQRFHTGVPIGCGASGQVVRSWDPQLERDVALKLLRRDDPESVTRMLAEARSQARVDHANIAKIYEVGELDGRPYIAMQYVDGRPLDEATAGLPIELRVALVAVVADAVHAAHEAGLIHRDLKPANILVESQDDRPVPYVLDFGIAREQAAEGLTQTGQILGTPGYLSPEQARGEVHTLDRRSDVFSLGAILYRLLAGRSPFVGASKVDTLVRVLEGDCPPIRRHAREIPPDLATIVHKALAHEPERRYETAAALAADLRRYLAKEPISARPASLGYRLGKRVRRHPRSFAVAAAALVVLVLVSFLIRDQARRQLTLAERFGDRVERLSRELDLAYRLPLHDVAVTRRRVAEQLEALQQEVDQLGRLALGPGEMALGRGFVALDELERARDHLEHALAAGYDPPELSLLLGQALSGLYFEAVDRLTTLEEPSMRVAALASAETTLARPALALLERARAADLDLEAHQLAALSGVLALQRKEHDEALRQARAAARQPWYHQAQRLAARIHVDRGAEALALSELEVAERELAAARDQLLHAVAKAPSDPRVRLELCRVAVLDLERVEFEGGDLDPWYRRAIADCDRALEVDSGSIEPLLERAQAGWRMARATTRSGLDPRPFLDQAMADARRALESGQDWRALSQMAATWAVRAERQADLGHSPFEAWQRAASALEAAAEEAPGNHLLRLQQGRALTKWGQQLSFAGLDPVPVFERAVELYRALPATDDPSLPPAIGAHRDLGLCNVETEIGYYLFQQGQGGGTLLGQAVEACRRAVASLPGHLQARHNLGYALWSLAEYQAATGADPRASFAAAAESFESVLELDPDRSATRVNLAHLYEELAAWAVKNGDTATGLLDRAETFNRSVAEIYPADFHLIQGKIERVRALDRIARGDDPRSAFASAEEHGLEAVRLQPGRVNEMVAIVELFRQRALWHQREGRRGEALRDSEAGCEWVQRALAIDADHPQLSRSLDELEAVLRGS